MAAEKVTHFLLNVNGEISSVKLCGAGAAYVKWQLTFGQDWSILEGMNEGVTQQALKPVGERSSFVYNCPLDFSFKSFNVHGWPRLVFNLYGDDVFGRDVIMGCGSVLIPVAPGSYTLEVPLFVPRSSSLLQSFIAWILGNRPEYIDPTVVAKDQGRQVTRVTSNGSLIVKLNVRTKDMEQLGYVTHEIGATMESRELATGDDM